MIEIADKEKKNFWTVKYWGPAHFHQARGQDINSIQYVKYDRRQKKTQQNKTKQM